MRNISTLLLNALFRFFTTFRMTIYRSPLSIFEPFVVIFVFVHVLVRSSFPSLFRVFPSPFGMPSGCLRRSHEIFENFLVSYSFTAERMSYLCSVIRWKCCTDVDRQRMGPTSRLSGKPLPRV